MFIRVVFIILKTPKARMVSMKCRIDSVQSEFPKANAICHVRSICTGIQTRCINAFLLRLGSLRFPPLVTLSQSAALRCPKHLAHLLRRRGNAPLLERSWHRWVLLPHRPTKSKVATRKWSLRKSPEPLRGGSPCGGPTSSTDGTEIGG